MTKYAMYSLGEQIHVASWPSFSQYRGLAYGLGLELNTAASQLYAAEGQCFVLAQSGVVSDEMVEVLCDSQNNRALLLPAAASPRAYGPDGRPLGEPLEELRKGCCSSTSIWASSLLRSPPRIRSVITHART